MHDLKLICHIILCSTLLTCMYTLKIDSLSKWLILMTTRKWSRIFWLEYFVILAGAPNLDLRCRLISQPYILFSIKIQAVKINTVLDFYAVHITQISFWSIVYRLCELFLFIFDVKNHLDFSANKFLILP